MGNSLFRSISYLSHRKSVILLAFLWISGLLLGTDLALRSGNSYYLLMHTAASSCVSIAGLIACSYLPFLLAALAVYINKPKLIFGVCFFKAIIFSHAAYCAVMAFGSAGWLVRFLLQFSDLCMVPVLCWFSIRHISGRADLLNKDFILCSFSATVVVILDYCFVSPFLAILIDI